jgi:transcriptional regulator with XRE-family HTH domain
MPITIELGLRIRAIRKSRNLSQEQLAELCNLHPTYIGQLERGEKNATLESICKISNAFHMSLEKLFEGIEIKESDYNNEALRIYHQIIALSTEKQQTVCSLFQILLNFVEGH